MSQFSNQLQASIEAAGVSQNGLAEKVGISQGGMSRYASGEVRPPLDQFDKIMAAFPREHQVALLLAYLADDIPSAYRGLVNLVAKSASAPVSGEPPPFRERMRKELREAYDFMGADAIEHADAADFIIAHYRRLNPKS